MEGLSRGRPMMKTPTDYDRPERKHEVLHSLRRHPTHSGKIVMNAPSDGHRRTTTPPADPRAMVATRSLPSSPCSTKASTCSGSGTPKSMRSVPDLRSPNGRRIAASGGVQEASEVGERAQGSTLLQSSLLSRRMRLQDSRTLQVEVPASEGGGSGANGGNSHRSQHARRRIKKCRDFAELYELGRTVMPSCHHDMEIRFASRKEKRGDSRRDVVVKIRRKPGSFASQDDERSWRSNTELVLNLPDCAAIARIDEVLEDAHGYYVVMEKVDGLDLHESLHREGNMPTEEVKEVLRQLLYAVAELHANGCIHKDLKLENVMLSPSPKIAKSRSMGSIKVIDFDTVEDWSPKTPKAKRVLGTDQYIAPEAYEGRYSPASDIFAVGVIAYKLLTNSFPFDDNLFDDKPGENWVGSPKMRQIRERLHGVRLDWQRPRLLAMSADERGLAQRLLSRMLAVNELHRPSAEEALRDPWLTAAKPSTPNNGQRLRRRRSSLPAQLRDESGKNKHASITSPGSFVTGPTDRAMKGHHPHHGRMELTF